MCQDVQVEGRIGSQAHVHQRYPRPNVVTCKNEEHALAAVENYKSGQVDIYVDASLHNEGQVLAYAKISYDLMRRSYFARIKVYHCSQ